MFSSLTTETTRGAGQEDKGSWERCAGYEGTSHGDYSEIKESVPEREERISTRVGSKDSRSGQTG